MTTNSKVLFQQLAQRLTLEADESEKEAIVNLLLEHQYGISRIDVMKGKEVDGTLISFNEAIGRLNKNEPIQYVLGEAYFYGRKFSVNSSVLIPRPETELLIEAVVFKLKNRKDPTIIDIGTGSGCIAITLSLEVPSSKVMATDISENALDVAKQNASKLRARIIFHRHNILTDKLNFGAPDMIVSNPPYVAETERSSMQKNVVQYEPAIALFVPDNDPLKFYKSLADQAASCLKSGGFLITEINERFGKETVAIFTGIGLADAEIVKDLDGKDRLVMARKL